MTAIVSLGPRTASLAARVAAALPRACIHTPTCAACPADVRFTKAADHLRALYTAGTPIVGLCASGILIRALAPLLGDKRAEPPVVAVAADGSSVVPLLGGHHGANELARTLAAALRAHAAVTTAGDLLLGTALDAPPPGWSLPEPEAAKAVMTRLLDGGGAAVVADDEVDASWLHLPAGDDVLIRATVRCDQVGDLVLHPRQLALGVGCERDVPAQALIDHARHILAEARLAPAAVACVVSLDLKAAEPAVHALAGSLGVPARFFGADALRAETSRLATPSTAVQDEVSVPGVAEAAGLAAAGSDGRLIVPKRIGARVTCAIAMAPRPIDPTTVGRPQGRLAIVGLGPGGPAWRTADADALIAAADELVGYGLYLDLAGHPEKPRHDFPLGAERERCRFALDRAAEGLSVALVCSGDPGVYALATLIMEVLEREPTPGRERVAVTVSPGVSALFAAAARTGAPLGHDFCTVSLSDLMTPWLVIERRLEAAAAGDFVTALYNPVSQRRREALPRARAIFLRHRGPATPVIVARNLGRADERIDRIDLAGLDVDRVDMLSIVVIGSSITRRFTPLHGSDWIYTPRGYDLATDS